jgi:hypothetical protein
MEMNFRVDKPMKDNTKIAGVKNSLSAIVLLSLSAPK